MNKVYLDNAATTAVSPEVLEAMLPYFTQIFGNASSIHSTGRDAHRAVDAARKQVAAAIGALPQEIYFTAGGSESDNWAIKGAAMAKKDKDIAEIKAKLDTEKAKAKADKAQLEAHYRDELKYKDEEGKNIAVCKSKEERKEKKEIV